MQSLGILHTDKGLISVHILQGATICRLNQAAHIELVQALRFIHVGGGGGGYFH